MRKTIACLFFLCVTCFGATDYWVRPDGNDLNTGLVDSPGGAWRNIRHADGNMTISPTGTTVHVRAGTYSGNVTCAFTNWVGIVCINQGGNSQSARLRYQCETPATMAMIGTTNGCLIVPDSNTFVSWSGAGYPNHANYVDVVGFHFAGNGNLFSHIAVNSSGGIGPPEYASPNVNSWHTIGNLLEPAGATVAQQCNVNTSGAAMEIGGSHGADTFDNQIIGNIIGFFGSPTTCQYGYGIYSTSRDVLIELNIVMGSRIGIHAYDGFCGGRIANNLLVNQVDLGMLLWNHSNQGECSTTPKGINTVVNNMIYHVGQGFTPLNGEGAGIQFSRECDSTHPTRFSNNLMFGNKAGNFLGYNGTVTDTCVSATTTIPGYSPAAIQPPDNTFGTIAEDPTVTFVHFSDTWSASNDFHLKLGSKAIGAGVNGQVASACVAGGTVPCTPATDFAGSPWGPALSIGVYSSAVGPLPPTNVTATVN